jgi:leucyl/phenylalanyl-tRNA--protein transferase
MIQLLDSNLRFIDPRDADVSGIVAVGGDLSSERLLLAYRSGIFPWYSENDPILWHSPNPRFILELDEFKLSRSLKKRMKHFEVRFNGDFESVIRECASIKRVGQNGAWLLDEMVNAYIKLHHLGHAMSVESYQNGELVGGLYGVVVGKVFCGESMFSHVSDASKVAFASLVKKLKDEEFELIDAQVYTNHLSSLGAKEISRDEFLARLHKFRNK